MLGFNAATSAAEIYRIMTRLAVCRAFAYKPEQLFDLAADVERYPEFLPRWVTARVQRRKGNVYFTDQVVGFAMIRARFGSKTVLRRPERIDVTSTDWPFRNFHLTWLFGMLPTNECQVVLKVDLKLRSHLLGDLFGRAIVGEAESIMSAFEARAHKLYGSPAGSCLPARNGPTLGPNA